MKPVFNAAKAVPMEYKRVIFAEGEDERVLHAVRVVIDEGLARPILIGRPSVIEMRIKRIGLNLVPERDFDVVNPESDPRYPQVHPDPTPEQIAEVAAGAARHARRFGIAPKIALCSHSQFGNLDTASGLKMRRALELLDSQEPDFSYEGEMHVDAALDAELRARIFPNSRMEGAANILIFSNTDAASGVRNILKARARGLEVGPILMGMGNRAHIVTPSITARGLLNMSAVAGTPVAHYG
jgi:phosphotransacetylase